MTAPRTAQNPRIRVAALVIRDDEALLVRHEKLGKTYWLLPGGGVDYGEPLAAALVREVREETGLDIRPGRLVLVNDSIPPDKHRHAVNLVFTASAAAGSPRLGGDPRLAEVAWQPVEHIPTLPLVPAVGQTLHELIRTNYADAPVYLGNLWKEL